MDTAEQQLDRLIGSGTLPSMPQVLVQLIDLCQQPEVDLGEVGDLVEKDTGLSGKVLQLANSSFIGARSAFGDVRQAVIYLGADTVKNLAIAVSVQQVFRKLRTNGLLSLDRFWFHSYAAALLARRIARMISFPSLGEAYLAGLLHDIGKLLLWMAFPGRYAPLLLHKITSYDGELVRRETEKLGIDHCRAGFWLADRWQLEKLISDAVGYHHHPLEEVIQALPLVRIVYLADVLAHCKEVDALCQEVGEKLFGLSSKQLEKLVAGVEDDVMEVAAVLGIRVCAGSQDQGDDEQAGEGADENGEDVTPELVARVEDISRLAGVLDNLLRAGDREQIFLYLEQGLKIFFDGVQCLLLLHDHDSGELVGACSQDNLLASEASRLRFHPDQYAGSLVARAFVETGLCTLVAAEDTISSLLDRQFLHLFETEALAMLSLRWRRKIIGVLVIGLGRKDLAGLLRHQKTLRLVADQAAVSLYMQDMHDRETERRVTERLEAVSLMARKIAHEINNPLGIIRNYINMLRFDVKKPADLAKDLQLVDTEFERIGRITARLSELGRSQSMHMEKIDVNQAVEDIIRLFRLSLDKQVCIAIDFVPEKELPSVITDPGCLRQILINLLGNSMDAIGREGTITVSTSSVSNHMEQVKITVCDDGPGIPEPILPRLYEAGVTTKGGGHAGLGMSVVRKLVQEMGGEIHCTTSDSGTCFAITLPVER